MPHVQQKVPRLLTAEHRDGKTPLSLVRAGKVKHKIISSQMTSF